MDLAGTWQEHKTFITLVVAGLLVYLIGQLVISELYPINAEKAALAKASRDLQLFEAVQSADLADAAEQNETLAAGVAAAVGRVNFVPRPEFLLVPGESPDVQYFRIVGAEREALVEWPKTQNITVAENLGMPELSPTKRKEIERALLCLDVVDRVVSLAIKSDVREVALIELVPDPGRRSQGSIEELKVRFKMRGTMAALAAVLEGLQLQENTLVVDKAKIECPDEDESRVEADLTLSALTFRAVEEDL